MPKKNNKTAQQQKTLKTPKTETRASSQQELAAAAKKLLENRAELQFRISLFNDKFYSEVIFKFHFANHL
jgi:hypothetical protein